MAVIVAGTEQVAVDGVARCVIEVRGEHRAAYLKRVDRAEVVAEFYAALLLRRWGLPVPEPFLVEERDGLVFATTDANAPDVRHQFKLRPLPERAELDQRLRAAEALVVSFPSSALAAACDEAIGNRDRTVGNILWDGHQETWIDHAASFGLGYWLRDRNQLVDMARHIDQADEFLQRVLAAAATLDRRAPAAVAAGLPLELGADRLAAIVSDRMATLQDRLVARVPLEVML